MKRIISILLMLMLLGGTALAEESAETDWYETHARELADDVYQLCTSELYRESVGLPPTLNGYLTEWAQAIEAGETEITRNDYILERSAASLMMLLMPPAYRRTHSVGGMLASVMAGQKSAEFLAASMSVNASMGYLMPEDFTPCDITFHYDSIDIAVFFSQYGEGVVRGEAFIIVPDKE